MGSLGKTILVADDSKTIQKVVELTFAKTEFAVITADDGREAIARAAEARPDVILADIGMPAADGYEVCAALKSRPDTQSIAVVLLGGARGGLDRARAEDAHADAHIDKPFDTQELITLVKRITGASIDSALPMSFAATLAQRRGENNPAHSNARVLPGLARTRSSVDLEPAHENSIHTTPTEDVLIEEGEPVELEAVAAGPFLEPPAPPESRPMPANVDVWALADGDGGTHEAADAIEDVSIDHEAPVGHPLRGPTPAAPAIAREVSEQAAAPVSAAVHSLLPDLPREHLTALAREVIEKVAWEVVPELAETLIREELDRLLAEE